MPPYTWETTAEEVASACSSSIKGKTVLVTGVSPKGLGANFAIAIAKHAPALIILAGRDTSKAEQTAKAIAAAASPETVAVRILKLDLASQTQIREAATEVRGYSDKPFIDVLVNNAGIMGTPYKLTEDGIESQFGANHIGHFLFTNLIIDKLIGGISEETRRTARVINVSSDGYRFSPVRFGDWNFSNGKTYDPWRAYGQSKTANLLFSKSLASKLAHRGLISVSLHPGVIQTNLGGHINTEEWIQAAQFDRDLGFDHHLDNPKWKTPSQGVATHVFASFDESITTENNNGAYLEDCRVLRPEEIHPWGRDEIGAEMLWDLSEELVGEKFSY